MVLGIWRLLLNRLKIWLLHLIGVLKRGLCCFRRRRRNSADFDPLTEIDVIPISSPTQEVESWDQWGDGSGPENVVADIQYAQHHHGQQHPGSIQEHIDLYRQQTMAIATRKAGSDSEEGQQDTDYFQDMTPRLTKQKKILLRQKQRADEGSSSNISLGMQIAPVQVGSDLGEWEENPGWDDEGQLDCDQTVDMIVREKRRQERERRAAEQQQRRLERQGRAVTLGARIS